jgi:O-antigen ligase
VIAPRPRDTFLLHRSATTPAWPTIAFWTAAALAAALAGAFAATGHAILALAVASAAAFVPFVVVDLAAAMAGWVALLYVAHLAGRGVSAVAVMLLLGWVCTVVVLRRRPLRVVETDRSLFVFVLFFAGWLVMTLTWAQGAGRAAAAAAEWSAAALAFLVVATTLAGRRDARVIALGFLAGAVVSATVGFLGVGGPSGTRAAAYGHRLVAGGEDPNYQAAAFLAAMFLGGGLIGVYRRPAARAVVALALAVVAIAFVATESRGGLVALAVTLFVAFVLFPALRGRILVCALLAVAGLAAWLSSRPDALHRLTHLGGGAGRSDEWTVAWRIFSGHPLTGVGLGNFQLYEPRYVLEPGSLTSVKLIAETPLATHNTYLQLLAETGAVGLLAFLLVVFGSLYASWCAAHAFDALGEVGNANLARAVLLGTVGMLVAMFFISDGSDLRLWILFALGPVLLALSRPSSPRAESRRS